MYQKEVNRLKNDSKLKSMKYLVKILFYLDKLVSCLPQLQNHWCLTVNKSSVAIFVSQAKMQLRQVNKNPNRFAINLPVTSSCEVTISLHEVRGQFLYMVTSNCVLISNEKSQPLTSCIFITSSEGHTCPGTDLWPHVTSQNDVKPSN